MIHMNRIILVFIVGCILASCLFSGCTTKETQDKNIIYVDCKGTKQYTSIQEAIDNAHENVTVYVYPGTYYENLVINTSIILKGEDKENTVIDGNHTGDVIYIGKCGPITVSGFTIRNSATNQVTSTDAGIEITSNKNIIIDNIFYNNSYGIYASDADYNSIKQNIFDTSSSYGMYLYSSCDYTLIEENVFTNNDCGLRIKGSTHNNITKNMFLHNGKGMYFCCGARLNTVYHNTFMNNTVWNADDTASGNNWDGGYPTGGNYWNDYTGKDEYQGYAQNIVGSDSLGDAPYYIVNDGTKKDNYPLMEPVVRL